MVEIPCNKMMILSKPQQTGSYKVLLSLDSSLVQGLNASYVSI